MNEVRNEMLQGYRAQQDKIDRYERLLEERKRSKREATRHNLHDYLSVLSVYVGRQSDFYYYSV
jgi:hypothetical protein